MNDPMTGPHLGWVLWINFWAIVPFAVLSWGTYVIACKAVDVEPYTSYSDVKFRVSGVFTGIVERFFFGITVALNISGIGTAMIMWTLLKAQSHWQLFNNPNKEGFKNPKPVTSIYIGILFSMLSMLSAAIVGHASTGKPWPHGWWPWPF